jgi:hypothetical protein
MADYGDEVVAGQREGRWCPGSDLPDISMSPKTGLISMAKIHPDTTALPSGKTS